MYTQGLQYKSEKKRKFYLSKWWKKLWKVTVITQKCEFQARKKTAPPHYQMIMADNGNINGLQKYFHVVN